MSAATLVQELWNFCDVLRDDGMSYGDYPRLRGDRLPQLTHLLFLKACPRPDRGIADERSRPLYNQPNPIPAPYACPALLAKDGNDLFDHYRHTFERLGAEKGTLALIFSKAQNGWSCREGLN